MKRYWLLLKQPRNALLAAGCLSVVVLLGAAVTMHFVRRAAAERELAAVHEYTVITEEPVQFETQAAKSYGHTVGFKEVRQTGAMGKKQVTHSVKVRGDGTELAKQKVSEEVTALPVAQIEIIGARLPGALTKAKSAHHFTDSKGVVHRETYYDLPMNVVMTACGAGGRYSVREDGAKVDKDGYVIVAANYGNYPRCSVVETSMGPGRVYDTGGFAKVHPHGFDLATDWTKADGR